MISTAAAIRTEGGDDALDRRVVRALLAAFAFGIAGDVVIVVWLSGGSQPTSLASIVLGLPLLLAAGWQLATRPRIRALPPPLLFLVGYVAWAAASVFWSSASPNGFRIRTLTNIQLVAFVCLAWQVVRTREDVAAMLWGYVAGCVLIVALTWRAFLAGQIFVYGRYAPAQFDPNDMCVYVALGVPMAAWLALRGRAALRVALWLYLPLAVSAIALSGSRTGLVAGTVAMVGVLLWVTRRSRIGSLFLVAVLFSAVALAATVVPPDVWLRLFTIQDELNRASGRSDIWRAGFDVLARNPVLGVGAAAFESEVLPILTVKMPAHSTPLGVAVEHGLIGLVLFFGAFAAVVVTTWRSTFADRALAWTLVATFCMGSLSLSWEARKPAWVVALLGAALAALPRRSSPEREVPGS